MEYNNDIKRMGDYIQQIRGITYKKDDTSDILKEGYVPIFRANNIQNGKLNYLDLVYVKEKKIKQNQFVKKGDIIIASSSGSKHLVGKAAQVTDDIKISFGAFCKLIRAKKDIDSSYLGHYFNSDYYRETISSLSAGANINNIKNEDINDLEILVPSIETQKQIVEILDESQSLIDNRKEQIELLDDLIESIFYDMFGDPVKNDKGWEVDKLGEITSKIGSGATPRGGESSYKQEGISLIRSMNVHDGKFVYKGLAFIDEEQANKLSNVEVSKGDVLINITGASINRTCIVPNDVLPARVNQHVSILRTTENIDNNYLLNLLISRKIKRKLYSIATSGGATREAITKGELEDFEIPIPPIDLQNQFAEKVQAIEHQKQLMNQSLKLMENNYNSLMQKAFKGELFACHSEQSEES